MGVDTGHGRRATDSTNKCDQPRSFDLNRQPLVRGYVAEEKAYVPSRNWGWVWNHVPAPLLRCVTRLLRLWCVLRSEGRSFDGHIRILLSRKSWVVLLGPHWERLPAGDLIPNRRTGARTLGIDNLVCRYPWASTIDREIYLEGFDAGEQFVLGSVNRQGQEHVEVQS